MAACAKAWPLHFSPTARTTCRCRFFQATQNIFMPENPDTPIIMVGPGTGVAPFRAYLQERQVTGARGKNWLFFGAQHVNCDFAYEEDFDTFMKERILTRLDCAWSRDQAHKVYVQHKLADNAAD